MGESGRAAAHRGRFLSLLGKTPAGGDRAPGFLPEPQGRGVRAPGCWAEGLLGQGRLTFLCLVFVTVLPQAEWLPGRDTGVWGLGLGGVSPSPETTGHAVTELGFKAKHASFWIASPFPWSSTFRRGTKLKSFHSRSQIRLPEPSFGGGFLGASQCASFTEAHAGLGGFPARCPRLSAMTPVAPPAAAPPGRPREAGRASTVPLNPT